MPHYQNTSLRGTYQIRQQENCLIVRLYGNIFSKGKMKAHFSGYCLRKAAELSYFAEYRLDFGEVSWSVIVNLLKCWSTLPKTADDLTFGILPSQAQQQVGLEDSSCTDIWSLNTELICVVPEEKFVLVYCLCSIVSTRVIAAGPGASSAYKKVANQEHRASYLSYCCYQRCYGHGNDFCIQEMRLGHLGANVKEFLSCLFSLD